MTGAEQVLVEDWCQQYPSHSVGTVEFGRDGALYASGGDGASFNFVDYGQDGAPVNPCGDPPGGVGATLTPPTAEGGALRSQDLRTAGDPVSLDGSVIRVDPATGDALPDNPLAAAADGNARRIISHGLRNPFRFTQRPGTDDLWVGDVGWNDWEEIDVLSTWRAGGELRLALLRGRRTPGRLRQREPQHLREPLCEPWGGHRAVPHLSPQTTASCRTRPAPQAARPSPGWTSSSPPIELLPGRVRRRAVLRRLLAGLHLGDAEGRGTEGPRRASSGRSSPVPPTR